MQVFDLQMCETHWGIKPRQYTHQVPAECAGTWYRGMRLKYPYYGLLAGLFKRILQLLQPINVDLR